MRLSLLYPLALLAGFAAAAGPIARDDGPGVSELGSSKVPDFDEVDPSGPSGNAVVRRDDDELTKREEFNPLEDRDDHGDDWHKHPAILVVCRSKECTGKCIGYNLNKLEFKKCYEAEFPYKSVYIISKKKLDFGVYVANKKCRGMSCIFTVFRLILKLPCFPFSGVRIPKVGKCFRVKPYGTTFFKWKKKHDEHDDHW